MSQENRSILLTTVAFLALPANGSGSEGQISSDLPLGFGAVLVYGRRMASKLSRSASGTRHRRWFREIRGTVRSHLQHNYLLSDGQKKALGDEVLLLDAGLAKLTAAVDPYRDFIDQAHVQVRCDQRVADFLCDEAQREADGSMRPRRKDIDAILPGGFSALFLKLPLSRILQAGRQKTVSAAEQVAGHLRTLAKTIPAAGPCADALDKASVLLRSFNQAHVDLETQRVPLRSAVQAAIFEVRETLDQMDGRLRSHFSQDFIDSLYPVLTKKGTIVADDEDEDDDTSAPPDES